MILVCEFFFASINYVLSVLSTLTILILAQMGWLGAFSFQLATLFRLNKPHERFFKLFSENIISFSKNIQKFSHAVFLMNAFDESSQSHSSRTARFCTVLSCPISIDFKSNKIVNTAHSVQ